MRPLTSFLAAAALALGTLGLAAPASAHSDREELRQMRLELLAEVDGTPVMSDNVDNVANRPGQVGISGCFMQTQQLFVTSGLDQLKVWDVTDAVNPTEVGALDNVVFENEAMNCGEQQRKSGTKRFALIGIDLYQASSGDIEHVNVGGSELMIVDVTDPENPTIKSRVPISTGTHTVTCVVDRDCRYAYTSGDRDRFSVIDLRNLNKPVEVDRSPRKDGLQSFKSPTDGHKWNFDNDHKAQHTGFGGTSIWDVERQARPRLLVTTGRAGRGDHPDYEGYNDFIHHNSFRPNADAFKPHSKPSFKNGNVLLITEEDYEQTDCSLAGSFQTWHVKSLRNRKGPEIVPLDKVELTDLQAQQPNAVPTPRGGFCSSHWFDHRAGGRIVAVGFYNGGTQFLDVSNPKKIRSHGYAYLSGQVWDSRWVPIYKDGKQVQRKTNVAYSIDLARGLDVYVVDVGDGRGTQPTPGSTPASSALDRAAGAVLPIGVVGGALALCVAVRRRRTTD